MQWDVIQPSKGAILTCTTPGVGQEEILGEIRPSPKHKSVCWQVDEALGIVQLGDRKQKVAARG